MKQDVTGVGRSTVIETPTILKQDNVVVREQKPKEKLIEGLVPSGGNGLATQAPTEEQQTGSMTSMLDARSEQPHRRGRTSALKVQSHDLIKREMGLNARKAMKPTLERSQELKAGYDKFGGVP